MTNEERERLIEASEKPEHEVAREQLVRLIGRLGLRMEPTQVPRSSVQRFPDWECLVWAIVLKDREGREIHRGHYFEGLAALKVADHLRPRGAALLKTAAGKQAAQQAMEVLGVSRAWHTKGDSAGFATSYDGIRLYWSAPRTVDIVASLLLDGACVLHAPTFSEWCAEYGYDSDSIRARDTWMECIEIGGKMRRAFGSVDFEDAIDWAGRL